jgi:hypothetical protein
VISGEIIPGDYDHLLPKILDNPDRFLAKKKSYWRRPARISLVLSPGASRVLVSSSMPPRINRPYLLDPEAASMCSAPAVVLRN